MRSSRLARVARGALVCALAGGVVWACYGPTELVVTLSTDVDCATVQVNGVSIRTAASADELALAPLATESNACEGRVGGGADLGSIVLIPGGADDVVVQVALGVDRPTSECEPPDRIDGCIIARRRVGYVRHRSLRVPIELDRACLGTRCAANETCVRGACTSATVDTCSGDDCALEGDASARPPLPLDGSLRDALAPDGDGKPAPPDAGLRDAGALCPPRPEPPDCGGCPAGQECCITPIGAGGLQCVPAGTCGAVGVEPSRACLVACHCEAPIAECAAGPANGSHQCPRRVCGASCSPQR
ncbi:MAG: hypothetical protein KF894_21215 [Labilithrix sp.]|nr:hypothetical protein [Labilithrix sp.]